MPVEPTKPLPIYDDNRVDFSSCKYLEWLAPIRKGQRCGVIAPPKTGKTRLLQEIAQGVQALNPQVEVFALLVDQSPETIGQFSRFIPQDNLLYTTYDDDADRQVFVAEFLLNRLKRMAEMGRDVVVIVDSFNGISKAFNDTENSLGGKTLPCGLESKTLQYIKKYISSAGCIEGKGTITMIGSVMTETGNPFDDIIAAEIAPIVNYEIRLSDKMAYKRVYPALDKTKICVERRDCSMAEENRAMLAEQYIARFDAEKLLQAVVDSKTIDEFENRIK